MEVAAGREAHARQCPVTVDARCYNSYCDKRGMATATAANAGEQGGRASNRCSCGYSSSST